MYSENFVGNNCLAVPTIKPATTNYGQCKKRPVDYINVFIYPYGKVIRPFCANTDFVPSRNYSVSSFCTKSEGDAVTVIGIVVIDVTVVVDIAEVVAIIVVRRTKPPVARINKY